MDFDVIELERLVAHGAHALDLGPVALSITDSDGQRTTISTGWDPAAVTHIWSSSKWLTSATAMALVERGVVGLDDRVASWLDFWPHDEEKRSITLRHCLSLTSGLAGSHPSIMDTSLTLTDSVRAIAAAPIAAPAGTKIFYGGNGFQVAGLVCETAAKMPFAEAFDAEVAKPLGMTSTTFGDGNQNPWLGGGAHSSLNDMQRFIEAQRPRDVRILSAEAKTVMRSIQAPTAEIAVTPYQGTDRRYGLGVWLDETDEDGYGTRVSSQGLGGSTPWIDDTTGLAGCLFMEANYLVAYQLYESLISYLREAASAAAS